MASRPATDFARHWPSFRWQSDHVERSRSLDDPPAGPLIVVDADRVVYTERWLRRDRLRPSPILDSRRTGGWVDGRRRPA